ncbi:MAG: GspE/PulE family protein [Phycisphaerales bacterium]
MAKLDLDKLLNELSNPSPDAAKEPSPAPPMTVGGAAGAEGKPARRPTLAPQPDDDAPADDPDHDPEVIHKPSADGSLLDIYQPSADAEQRASAASDLGKVLVEKGVIDAVTLEQTQAMVASSPGLRLADAFIQGGIDEAQVQEGVADAAGLSFERLTLGGGPDEACDTTKVTELTVEFCRENAVLPLRSERGRLVVGMVRPEDVFTLDDLKSRLGVASVKPVVITATDLGAALAMMDIGQSDELDVDTLLAEVDEDEIQTSKPMDHEVDLEREAGESPVIRFVNYIIQQAVKEGASDIHIEPGEKGLTVRFRIDGVMFESMKPPAKMAAAITSRLKIMANLDISERRLPQDGRIRCTVQRRKLDLRVSTIPATYGEKTVMRILDTRSINVGLEELGFDDNALTIWKHQIDQPHGIVLVTGPTGSGKTTTLYASLRHMDKVSQNISTVEDPVEYHLDGITQTQMHEKIGMTFARALKALLRQDPDVIMVGEIRDQETAHTAIQASLTGHLVLSTLHTNDAPSAITRLVNIGVEPFLIAAAVNACLAQRLVRKICSQCKQPAEMSDDLSQILEVQGIDPAAVMHGKGCEKCRKMGYAGRLGIYELLVVDDHLRDVVARSPNVTEFRRMCCDRGMVTLRQDGFAKVKLGRTSVEEVLRVTENAI